MTITAKDFHSPEAAAANRLVDYYEGRQKAYVIRMLDGRHDRGMGARVDWRNRGFIPRVRNIVKSVADKRALLFNQPPKLELVVSAEAPSVVDPTFMSIMHEADWIAFWQVADVYVGLLRSVIVLQQKYIAAETSTSGGIYRYDSARGDALSLTMLHRGNAAVRMNVANTKITELGFLTDDPCDRDNGEWTYTKITPDEYTDVLVRAVGGPDSEPTEVVRASRPNLDGIVPASFVYDTARPRKGAWVDVPEDLTSFQELFNLHLTDLEFAIANAKQKTMFTDAKIVNGDSGATVQMPALQECVTEPVHISGYGIQRDDEKPTFGLGAIVTLNAPMGQDRAPMIKFDGPESDLTALDNVVRALMTDVAHDWDVNMRVADGTRANSGFQLIVEEIGNLTLREKRAESFQAAFRRFYAVTQRLYPELTEGSLWVEFAPPSLPVNTAEQEQMWGERIAGGRASVLDYLMEVKGLNETEAKLKADEIKALNDTYLPKAPVSPSQNRSQNSSI